MMQGLVSTPHFLLPLPVSQSASLQAVLPAAQAGGTTSHLVDLGQTMPCPASNAPAQDGSSDRSP